MTTQIPLNQVERRYAVCLAPIGDDPEADATKYRASNRWDAEQLRCILLSHARMSNRTEDEKNRYCWIEYMEIRRYDDLRYGVINILFSETMYDSETCDNENGWFHADCFDYELV